jgi:hypothetical protein
MLADLADATGLSVAMSEALAPLRCCAASDVRM